MSSTTTARQLRRLAGVAVLTAAMAAVPASAMADGASGAAGAAAPSAAPKAPALLAHAKKVKPRGKAARAKGVDGGGIVIGGPDNATGVFDEIVHFYSWQRLPSGYWVRAVSVVHHANFGSESGYMWQYWNGSRAVSYALCLASTGCRAY